MSNYTWVMRYSAKAPQPLDPVAPPNPVTPYRSTTRTELATTKHGTPSVLFAMSNISEKAANWEDEIDYRCPKCGSKEFWHEWLKFETVSFPNKSHKDVSYAPRDSRPPAATHVGCNRCDERIVNDGEFVAGKSRPVEEVREEHHCLDEH